MLDENPFLELSKDEAPREEFGVAQADTPTAEDEREIEFAEFTPAAAEACPRRRDRGSAGCGCRGAQLGGRRQHRNRRRRRRMGRRRRAAQEQPERRRGRRRDRPGARRRDAAVPPAPPGAGAAPGRGRPLRARLPDRVAQRRRLPGREHRVARRRPGRRRPGRARGTGAPVHGGPAAAASPGAGRRRRPLARRMPDPAIAGDGGRGRCARRPRHRACRSAPSRWNCWPGATSSGWPSCAASPRPGSRRRSR